jgi:hypothetical protein
MDKEVGGRSLRPIRHMESVVGRRTDASEDYPLADTSLADGCLDLLKEIGARVQAKDMEPSDTGWQGHHRFLARLCCLLVRWGATADSD